jgi:glycosyltransferase involved in cell wall biosynthesis
MKSNEALVENESCADDALSSGPLWSVMIPTYRPTEHLRETIKSALDSLEVCGRSFQLAVVDDASPDVDVDAALRDWGFRDVEVHRRENNGGLAACWNACIERARGRLIHILHQDDMVRPTFHLRMMQMNGQFESAGMIFCRTEFIRGGTAPLEPLEQANEGLIPGWLEKICEKQRLHCPSVVVRRETYERVGKFDDSLRYIIDWEMWVRIAAHFPVAYLPEALARYRDHGDSESGRLKARGIITKDLAQGVRRIHDTLRKCGRTDCMAAVVAYALSVSDGVAWEAQDLDRPDIAVQEMEAAFLHFGVRMDFRSFFRHLKQYLKVRRRMFSQAL